MLQTNCKFIILIPAYNEAKNIRNIISELNKAKYSFLVVNDGSTDETLDILFAHYVNYITYSPNHGRGYAVKRGAKELIEKGCKYILIMDADEQHSIKDIPIFLQALKQHPEAKIIVGNRLHNPVGMPIERLWTNKIMSWLISLIIGKKVIDSQCGFKLIHRDIFTKLDLLSNRFELESEMLIKAGLKGYEIKNMPVKCIYKEGRKSKINSIKDTIRFFKMLGRIL